MQLKLPIFLSIVTKAAGGDPVVNEISQQPTKPFFRPRNIRKGVENLGRSFTRFINGAPSSAGTASPRTQTAVGDFDALTDSQLSRKLTGLSMPKRVTMTGDEEALSHARRELFDSPDVGHSFHPVHSGSEKTASSITTKVPDRRARSLTPSVLMDGEVDFDGMTSNSGSISPFTRTDMSSMTPVEESPVSDIREKYRLYLEQQAVSDVVLESRCTPNLSSNSFTDAVKSGRKFHLNSLLYASRMSTVFSISGSDDLVAKYQTDCFESSQIVHPLVKDYFVYKQVEDMGIAPRAFFVSPPARAWPQPQPHGFAKAGFKLSAHQYTTCSSQSSVRYIIMDKVGKSLSEVIGSGTDVGFVNAVLMGVEMIESIRLLHQEKKIVHGDVHQGNFVIHGGRIKVIDFGRFEWIEDQTTGHDHGFTRRPFRLNHPFFSHWEIAGFKNTRRDDVFKVLMIVAALMNGERFNTYISNDIYGDTGLSFTVKAYKNIFVLHEMTSNKYIGDPVLEHPSHDATTRDIIRNRLAAILKQTRSLDLYEEPDYNFILSNLCSVADAMIATRVRMENYDGQVASSICTRINQTPSRN